MVSIVRNKQILDRVVSKWKFFKIIEKYRENGFHIGPGGSVNTARYSIRYVYMWNIPIFRYCIVVENFL